MGKSKAPKTSSKKSEVNKSLSTVKNAAITKPSQTPVAKSKQIAKDTAAKVKGHSKKPVKKAATPSSDSDDSADSDDSESESETEVEAPKPVAKGKVNGKSNGKVASDSSSEESSEESDSSESDDESSEADSGDEKVVAPAAAATKDDSDDSDSSEDDEEDSEDETPAAKVEAAAPAKVNGAAKAVKAVSHISTSHMIATYICIRAPTMKTKTKMTAPTRPPAAVTTRKMQRTPTILRTRAKRRKRHHPRSARLRMTLSHPQRRPRSKPSLSPDPPTYSSAT